MLSLTDFEKFVADVKTKHGSDLVVIVDSYETISFRNAHDDREVAWIDVNTPQNYSI